LVQIVSTTTNSSEAKRKTAVVSTTKNIKKIP
jgi:hypothetical protein